jgi:hypothetical protein
MLLAGLQVPIALIEVPTGLDICAHFVQPGEEVVLAGSQQMLLPCSSHSRPYNHESTTHTNEPRRGLIAVLSRSPAPALTAVPSL